MPAFRVLALAALLPASAALAAAVLPGNDVAVITGLEDKRFIWVNPARLAAEDSADLRFGYAGFARNGSLYTHFDLPAGFAAAWEIGKTYQPDNFRYDVGYDYSYYYQRETSFYSFALAKQGFASGGFLSQVSLGLNSRYFQYIGPQTNDFGGTGSNINKAWSLDGGVVSDVPLGSLYGDLTLGLYSLQITSALFLHRFTGLQGRWADASGRWGLSGNIALVDPEGYRELPPAWTASEHIPASRIALDFTAGNWSFEGQALPAFGVAGLGFGWHWPLRTILWDVGLNVGMLSAIDHVSPVMTGRLEAAFRGPRGAGMARTYSGYRRRTLPDRPADSLAARDTATLPPVTDVGRLSEADWNRNWALYQEDRIGFWRGTAWPYVNTFGWFTTFIIPAGTSCMAVNEYIPGAVMFAGSIGLWVYMNSAVDDSAEEERRFAIFALGQAGLKLTDFLWARYSVKHYNAGLRKKYRLALAPDPRGGAALMARAEF
jgi:hypothetical protein